MSIDISLLPRADLPVIWEDFKAKAEAIRTTAETLTVTSITQKEEMALARKTRLTLREIRVAVEHKRVELGEGHLKEIQKVNGAAKAIREFIEPLEARLLVQESFAERAEADRIVELSKRRNDEVRAVVGIGVYLPDFGKMSQPDYDTYLAGVRSVKAELEAANRFHIEAESRLAAQKLEMELREVAIRAEATKIMLAQQVEAKAELDRREEAAEKRRQEERIQWAQDVAVAEAKQRELKREQEAKFAAEVKKQREEAEANARVEATYLRQEQERLRIRDEQLAAAEEKLAAIALDAARVAAVEEKRLRDIEVAPDAAKLIAYVDAVRSVSIPVLHSKEANTIFNKVAHTIAAACGELRIFGQ